MYAQYVVDQPVKAESFYFPKKEKSFQSKWLKATKGNKIRVIGPFKEVSNYNATEK